MIENKCWRRAKSGESNNYPRVWRNKKDGDDVVRIKRKPSIYLVERENINRIHHIAFAFTLKEANSRANSYIRRYNKC